MPLSKLTLSSNRRLKKRREYLEIQADGKKLYSKQFLIIVKKSERTDSRIGVTVTKKVDKRAVGRNRIKRRIKEIFRLNQFRLNGIFDILIIARHDAHSCNYHDMERQILGTLKAKGYLKDTP
ncbi:MAG: ribonuclease P protein component [Deltaproteobacteria bacterium]|nr:ribonuclease P protein component [Deltaproteobacteria bacterium]